MHAHFCDSYFSGFTALEAGRSGGRSIIAAVHSGKNDGSKSWLESPVVLMYGFRGARYVVDLLSPFEMLRYWRMEKVLPPKRDDKGPTAIWTAEGSPCLKN